MNISVIIPNFNGEKLIKKNLPKVLREVAKYRNGKTEIIIIDDCSSDESVRVINSFLKENNNLKFYKNSQNIGFAPSVNKAAREAKGDILLLLNTDVYPEEGFLSPLIKDFKDQQIFAVGCLDKSIENGKVVLRGRGLGQWKRGFLVHRKGEVDKSNTLWVSGGSGAYKRSIWDKLGGFNELFTPFYWEDIDLSYRALKSGYKILFDAKSIVVHEHESGAIKNKYTPFQIKTVAYKNQFIFVWANLTDIDLVCLHILWLPYHFLKAIISLDMAFYLGFLNALPVLPQILRYKNSNKKIFIIKDKELIKQFK